ncbi:hypothetical protein EV356DRAFT_419553, partial [Viridothelium virens]
QVRLAGEMQTFSVFKGIDFRLFLMYADGDNEVDDEFVRNRIKVWHHADSLIRTMPPHPNILPPPLRYVTVSDPGTPERSAVCGCLYPFFAMGDVGARIESSNGGGSPIPLDLKARWCAQMSAATEHAHLVVHSYHMDIKPGNFLIDDDENLILAGWEQFAAPATTLAPEADGNSDVEEIQASSSTPDSSVLKYTKYKGPERQNTDDDLGGGYSWNLWNVFPIWQERCPKA